MDTHDPLRTAWTLICSAQNKPADATVRQQCLRHLAETYIEPVRSMIRAWGIVDEYALDDCSQEYFLTFFEKNWVDMLDREKGSFRGFLRTSIQHFLLNHKRHGKRRPREVVLIHPDDDTQTLTDLPDSKALTPEEEFNRSWARTLMRNAIAAFHDQCITAQTPRYFDVFERHALRPEDYGTPSYRQTAAELHIAETDVTNFLHRARRGFSKVLCGMIRETVRSDSEVDEELQDLQRYFR